MLNVIFYVFLCNVLRAENYIGRTLSCAIRHTVYTPRVLSYILHCAAYTVESERLDRHIQTVSWVKVL